MAGSATPDQLRDRPRPTPTTQPRAPSRSSTASSQARMQPQSANSSSSQLPVSPQLGTSTHTHRLHHSTCAKGPSRERLRPRPQPSRESRDSGGSRDMPEDVVRSPPTPTPLSSFLQERLERERRVESERSFSRMSNDHMSASLDLRAVESSPDRGSAAERRRPRSSQGGGPAKGKGLGVKEMEQTLSTLHKQNFDLKLELYHRRERQSALEERVETAEAEKAELEDLNDKLMEELEKRDKAVEEAVAMIVTLEAKVEQLLQEREMVRQVDADGYFYAGNESVDGAPYGSAGRSVDLTRQLDHAKVVARMPSFISERSEGTENLRNVYLGVRGSLLSLPRMPEEGQDGEAAGDINRINSPTLSVLSESSFASVYGGKVPHSSSAADIDHLPSVDGLAEKKSSSRPNGNADTTLKSKTAAPTNNRALAPPRSQEPGQFQNIGDVLSTERSPLRRLESMERTLSAMDEASRPASKEKVGSEGQAHSSTPSTRSPSRPKTKEEKREALRRVLTDAPSLPVSRQASSNLPPTPDTMSTSTLRDLKNSNDGLPNQRTVSHDTSYLALSDTTTASSASRDHDIPMEAKAAPVAQAPSTSAFSSRREFSGNGTYFDNRLPIPPRPRSADETTVSHHRRNEWDSDSEDDDYDGLGSRASSFDYWMRESQKPNRNLGATIPPALDDGRASPDLFSFPASTRGWATDAMFGALGGAGFLGAAPSPLAHTLDALGDSLAGPLFGVDMPDPLPGSGIVPPPPPNRRSSLHAQTGTGSSAGVAFPSGSGSATPVKGPVASIKAQKSSDRQRRTRSNSTGSHPDLVVNRWGQAPLPSSPQQQLPLTQENLEKSRHYPPNSSQSQQPAQRNRSLNMLWRRSIGSSSNNAQTPTSTPSTETTFAAAPTSQKRPTIGVPSWGRRADMDDGRSGATPPPILRSRVRGRASSDADEAAIVAQDEEMTVQAGNDRPAGQGTERLKSLPGQVGRAIQSGAAFVARAAPGTSAGLTNGNPTMGDAVEVNGSADGKRAEPAPTTQHQQQQQTGKKKWLGLGRMPSLRNRAV